MQIYKFYQLSDELDLIFETDKDQKYAILILEHSNSYLGRKVYYLSLYFSRFHSQDSIYSLF
jgi:hypothetical protein